MCPLSTDGPILILVVYDMWFSIPSGTSEDPESSLGLGKKFTQSEKPVTLEVVKGTLLAVADQMLSVLSEIIMENAAQTLPKGKGHSIWKIRGLVGKKIKIGGLLH